MPISWIRRQRRTCVCLAKNCDASPFFIILEDLQKQGTTRVHSLRTEGGQTYHCNDDMVSAKPHHSELAWDNSYLVFLQVMPQADAQHAEDVSVADGIRISDAHPPEDDMEVDSDCGDAWKFLFCGKLQGAC